MAQTQLFTKKGQLQVVEEATQDTHVSPAATDGSWFLAEDISWSVDSQNTRLGGISPSGYHKTDEIPGAASTTLSFKIPLKHSGTATAAPDWAEAIKACGFEETVSTADVQYTPLSTFDGSGGNPGQSYTVNWLEDGMLYALKGGFGNVVFTLENGVPGYMEFTFSGAYVAPAEQALVSPTYQATTPPAFMGGSAAINFGGAYTPVGINTMSLDVGNVVTLGRDVNETYGHYGARITDRDPSGSIDAEMVATSTFDYFGTWVAGTNGTITTGTIGSAGNQWKLDVARAILRPPELAEGDNVRRITAPFSVSSLRTDTEGTNHAITLTLS